MNAGHAPESRMDLGRGSFDELDLRRVMRGERRPPEPGPAAGSVGVSGAAAEAMLERGAGGGHGAVVDVVTQGECSQTQRAGARERSRGVAKGGGEWGLRGAGPAAAWL